MNYAEEKSKKKVEYWKQLVMLLCLGWTVLWINRTILTPVIPEIMLDLNIGSEASAGLISSLFYLPYTLLQVPAGFLGDKYGRKLVLVPGLILFASGAIFSGLAMTFTTFLIARVITGMGQGTYFGPVYSLTSEYIPKEKRGISTAIVNSGTALGMGLGLVGSSYFVKVANLEWRLLLFASGALGLITALLFQRFLKSSKSIEKSSSTEDVQAVNTDEEKTSIISILKNPKMLGTCILYFGTCYGYYMIVTWLPSFLEQEKGFTGAAIGLASSLVAFTAVPGALVFSKVSDKFMNKKVSIALILEVLAAITLLGTVLVNSNELLIICLVLYGIFGKITVDPILVSHVGDICNPKVRTTSFGMLNFFGMSASVVAPYITGMLSDMTGSKITGFYLSAVIILIGILAMIIGNEIGKKREMTRQ